GVLPRRVHRHGVGVLPSGRRPALLRRWVLRNHRAVSGGGMASAAAGERHGVWLRRRQPGQDPRTARARADRWLVELRQPTGHRRSDLSRFSLSHILVLARRLRLLADRARDKRPFDRGNRQRAQRTRARDPFGRLERKPRLAQSPRGDFCTMTVAAAATNSIPWWKEPTKDQWLAWWAAWLGWTLDAFDFTVFLLIMVPIAQEFNVPLTEVTAVFTITLWMRLVGACASGWLADRVGRKIPLMISILW